MIAAEARKSVSRSSQFTSARTVYQSPRLRDALSPRGHPEIVSEWCDPETYRALKHFNREPRSREVASQAANLRPFRGLSEVAGALSIIIAIHSAARGCAPDSDALQISLEEKRRGGLGLVGAAELPEAACAGLIRWLHYAMNDEKGFGRGRREAVYEANGLERDERISR